MSVGTTTTDRSDLARRLLMTLRDRAVGRDRAVKADNLAIVLGCSRREVQAAVEELRGAGVFIASNRNSECGGLYLPATEEERRNALGSFRRATISQITTYNRLKRARRIEQRQAGQQMLF